MNNAERTPTRRHKRYSDTFKRQTAGYWMLSGKSARVIAAEPAANVESLQQWKQQFKALRGGQVAGILEVLQAENRRLWNNSIAMLGPML